MPTAREIQTALRAHPLYGLLEKAFPDHRTSQQALDIPGLAKTIGMSHEGVYKWIRANKVTPAGAKRLIDASSKVRADGALRLTEQVLNPFLFG